MTGEDGWLESSVYQIPDKRRTVFAARSQRLPIGREGNLEDSALVPLETTHPFRGGDLPDVNGPVPMAGSDSPAVGGVSKGASALLIQLADLLARGDFPQLGRLVRRLGREQFGIG